MTFDADMKIDSIIGEELDSDHNDWIELTDSL